jgi:hypothetical protein
METQIIVVVHEGIEYRCNNLAEAAELGRRLRSEKPAKLAPSAASAIKKPLPARKGHRHAKRKARAMPDPLREVPLISPALMLVKASDETWSAAHRFLRAIRDHRETGIQAEGLMPVFGVTKPKALGSRSGPVNKLIRDLGFSVGRVYKNPRTATGRLWKPGPKIKEVIELIEQRLKTAA